jgi:hypothetical protein
MKKIGNQKTTIMMDIMKNSTEIILIIIIIIEIVVETEIEAVLIIIIITVIIKIGNHITIIIQMTMEMM